MSISELDQTLYDTDYVVENPNQIIDSILLLFSTKDTSLINKEDLDKYPHENEEFFLEMNVKRIIRILNELLFENENKVDFVHFKKCISFIEQNYYFDAKLTSNVFRYVSNYDESEMLEIISIFKDEFINDNFSIVVNNLFKSNRLDTNLMKKLLEISNDVDVSYFSYLIPDFSKQFIELISNYDINIINFLKPEQITQSMIEKAKNDNRFQLSENSPSILFEDKEFLRRIIINRPYTIKEVSSLLNDKELLQIAIQSGLELDYNDFKVNNIFSSKILIKELADYYDLIKHEEGSVVVISKLILDHDEERILRIYELLKHAIENNIELDDILNYLEDKEVSLLLESFREHNLNIDFLLSNEVVIIRILESIGNEFANSILFEPTEAFVNEYLQLGYCPSPFSSESIKNSYKLFSCSLKYEPYQVASVLQNCNDEFISKEFIDNAIIKGVNVLENSLYEKTDIYLKENVEEKVSLLSDSKYKDFIQNIIKKAGYSIFYVESNNLLCEDVFNIFCEELITRLVRNLSFCGEKLDFTNLIELNKIELFKNFYFMVKEKNDALEFKYLLDFFNENIELVENLINSGMTDEEKEELREYIYHKDKIFKIHNKKYLANMKNTIYIVNNQAINDEPENTILLKSIVLSTLFNIGYSEVENILGIVGNGRLDSLKDGIHNTEYIHFINLIKPYIDFIEKLYSCNDNSLLCEIAINVNQFFINYNNEVSEIKRTFNDLESFIKKMYTEELNDHLSKLPNQSYIEYDDDSYFLAHVMNAFGSGSKLSDFKNPRFIGKTYICLSAIGRGINPYSREEFDMNHVTLLFNHIPTNSLISMSSRDMWSQGANGQMNVIVHNNFNTLFDILDKTSDYVPNEYVVYRENESGNILYPCGVLVVGDEPSQYEIEAANYLDVPLVKRKQIKRNKTDSSSDAFCELIGELNQNDDNDFYNHIINRLAAIKNSNKEELPEYKL